MTTHFTDHTDTEPADDAAPDAPTDAAVPESDAPAAEAPTTDALESAPSVDARVGELLDEARGEHLIEEAAEVEAADSPVAALDASAELVDVVEVDEEGGDDATAGDDEEAATPAEPSPYDRPGGWYVVHTYAGYENKVKSNLANRIRSMHVEERIFEVIIPMEDVIEFKGGQRRVVQKKVFPGYLLVRMDLDDDSWYVVRNTPGVTGFVGPSGSKPTPLSRKEVEDILGVEKPDGGPAIEKKVRPRVEFEEGEQVRVVTGPFADFNGAIAEIDVDRSKLKVLVNIFGRETPVELEFGQVAKL
jgi:transcriptional antiterminator NusG